MPNPNLSDILAKKFAGTDPNNPMAQPPVDGPPPLPDALPLPPQLPMNVPTTQEKPFVGRLLDAVKENFAQSEVGPGVNILSKLVFGNKGSIYPQTNDGTGDYLGQLEAQAQRIISKPIFSRTEAEMKFLETFPENRKSYMGSLGESKNKELKAMELAQKQAGAFGKLHEGVEYNALSNVGAFRVQMAKLIDKSKEYYNQLAQATKAGDSKAARSALEKLKSVANQNSALISQAAGQGAMSQADKENLDRQNAVISETVSDAMNASATLGVGAGLGFASFYPIYQKLRGNLFDAITSQQDFLDSTKAKFDRAAELYTPDEDQYAKFSGERTIASLPNYAAELADAAKDNVENMARKVELQQMAEAGKRTQEASKLYPNKLGQIEGLSELEDSGASEALSTVEAKYFNKLVDLEKQKKLTRQETKDLGELRAKIKIANNFNKLDGKGPGFSVTPKGVKVIK